jgi:hypothetical protein
MKVRTRVDNLISLLYLLAIAIHVILTPVDGVSEIPSLLEGKTTPAGDTENLGTRNYSKIPAAVITGAVNIPTMLSIVLDANFSRDADAGIPLDEFGCSGSVFDFSNLYRDTMMQHSQPCEKHLVERGFG